MADVSGRLAGVAECEDLVQEAVAIHDDQELAARDAPPLWIMIAGPYTAGGASAEARASNLRRLNDAALAVHQKGHVPIVGVNAALPMIEAAGPGSFDEIMMPLSLALAERCDAALRIGGASAGADREVEVVRANGGRVFADVADIPDRRRQASPVADPTGERARTVTDVAGEPVTFRLLTAGDIPRLSEWLARPHLQRWWRDEPITLDGVREKYLPRMAGEDDARPFLVCLGGRPVGYIQYYAVPEGETSWWPDTPGRGVMGIDQFIAEPSLMDRGLGITMVRRFTERLMADPSVTEIRVDPRPDNARAIRCYTKAGFREVGPITTPDGPAVMMVLTRPVAWLAPPSALERAHRDRRWTIAWQSEGHSVVHRLSKKGAADIFLKLQPSGEYPTANAEAERLQWVRATGLPVPDVLGVGEEAGTAWLTTGALPGVDGTHVSGIEDPARLTRALARGLRRFHDAAPVAACPFDFRLDAALSHVRRRLEAGDAPAVSFHREFQHLTPSEALDILMSTRPKSEDLVVCHGDYCPPNVMLEDGEVTGYLDLGELGVACRWWDVAVATWSLGWNLGEGYEALFLSEYGIAPDLARTVYYRLLYDLVC